MKDVVVIEGLVSLAGKRTSPSNPRQIEKIPPITPQFE